MGKVCSVLSGRDGHADMAMITPVLEQLGLDPALLKAAGLTLPVEAHNTATREIKLTGKKKSLLVGCNYFGTQNELHGCVNDVKRMLPVVAKLGFPGDAQSQMVLIDEEGSPADKKPTREHMLQAMKWLVEGAQPGDALFFHYSGHGGQEPAQGPTGDGDGQHETLVPLDFQTAGMLKDTDMFDVLVKPLPSGCRLTVILDSCHSAGALNLPFRFVGTEADLKKGLAGSAMQMVMSHNWSKDVEQWKDGKKVDLLKDIGSMGLGLWHLKQGKEQNAGGDGTGFKVEEKENAELHVGEVVAFTGCRSDQTSADVGDVSQQFHLKAVGGDSRGTLVIDSARAARGADGAGGALTTALLEALETMSSQKLTFLELLEQVRQNLSSKGFSQVPQVVTSLVVDLKQNFALDSTFIPQEAGKADGQDASASNDNSAEAGKPAADPLAGFLSALGGHAQGASMLQQAAAMYQAASAPAAGEAGAPAKA